MRKILSVTILALFVSLFLVRGGIAQTSKKGDVTPRKELIDIKADIVFPHKINADSSVLCLVGNFAAQHNGAIITADSAVRYSDSRIECFGNVLINKNTTYAYADRADYNGELNEVTLYSPLIKVVDEDVTLYTYKFSFNTLDNIGMFDEGGVAFNKDSSRLESVRGYYLADDKEVVGVEDVEIHTPDYDMKGDSVKYNMSTDYAEFYDRSNIWNAKGDYLYTDAGNYDKSLARFSFSRDGYILTREQEVWSDSLDYYREAEEVILRGNIQIDDTTNKILAWGDYGHYWGGELERAMLSMSPSLVSYDTAQSDSLFMRADTIILNTYNSEVERRETEGDMPQIPQPVIDSPKTEVVDDAPEEIVEPLAEPEKIEEELQDDTLDLDSLEGDHLVDSLSSEILADSTHLTIAVDSLAQDSTKQLSEEEQKALREEAERQQKEAKKAQKAEAKRIKADKASAERIRKNAIKLDAAKAREARKIAKRKEKLEARRLKRGEPLEVDSLVMDSLMADSMLLDSMMLDSAEMDSMVDDSLVQEVEPVDSIYRIITAYRNTKSYRSDFQSISDSLYADSRDTTLHLYHAPVLWNGENQISSNVMDIFTREGELAKALFTEVPIMASEVSGTYFNQVTGKSITSLFRDNEIYRNEVDGNVQTIYFAEDEVTYEVTTMAYIESGSATFYIENQALEGITYRSAPNYVFYPVEMIPESQPITLNGFEWQAAKRPTRQTFTDRTRRPSQRTAKESLPRPTFPIDQGITLEIEQLLKDRKWMDRTDVVAPHAEEWLESLGYKSGQPREKNSL